jgi:hypothetical protein
MSFDITVDEQGAAVVEVSLTIAAPSLSDAQGLMIGIRGLATSGSRTVAAGDFITRISVPEEEA